MGKEDCPICNNPYTETFLTDARCERQVCHCPNCGSFEMPRRQIRFLKDVMDKDNLFRHKCAAVMLERKLKGLNERVQLYYDVNGKGLIFEDTGERLKDFYPERFYEKLERGFFNLVRITKSAPWKRFSLNAINYNVKTLLFIDVSSINANVVFDYYIEEGWLKRYEYKDAANNVMH